MTLLLIGCVVGMGLLLMWNDNEHRKTINELSEIIIEQEQRIEQLADSNTAWQRRYYHDGFWEEGDGNE